MLSIRTVHIKFNLHLLDQITAVFSSYTEYYEGRTTPEEPTETENKQTPAFTLPSALLAIALLATDTGNNVYAVEYYK